MTKPTAHKERAHSKFSASGSERWLNCAASVDLCEKAGPSPDNKWSLEGTHAHEGLERMLLMRLIGSAVEFENFQNWYDDERTDFDMVGFVEQAADKIFEIAQNHPDAEIIAERRVHNTSIDKEMFGTTDAAILEIYGHLHVFDFKYGAGHMVNPEENTQLIQYALGFAEENDWLFQEITVHILQPRAGNNWHKQWTITMEELQTKWLYLFRAGVKRVRNGDTRPFPGGWCHWCSGKKLCPAFGEKQVQKAFELFKNNPNRKG